MPGKNLEDNLKENGKKKNYIYIYRHTHTWSRAPDRSSAPYGPRQGGPARRLPHFLLPSRPKVIGGRKGSRHVLGKKHTYRLAIFL